MELTLNMSPETVVAVVLIIVSALRGTLHVDLDDVPPDAIDEDLPDGSPTDEQQAA